MLSREIEEMQPFAVWFTRYEVERLSAYPFGVRSLKDILFGEVNETNSGFHIATGIDCRLVNAGQDGKQEYRRKWTRSSKSCQTAAKSYQEDCKKAAQSGEEKPESSKEGCKEASPRVKVAG